MSDDHHIPDMADGEAALTDDLFEISREVSPGVWQTFRMTAGALAAFANGLLTAGAGAGMNTFAEVETAVGLKAPLDSPALTGNPTAPTPSPGDNDTSIPTTAFVQAELDARVPPGAWTTWTPTVTATTPAGAGFAYTLTTARYAKIGRTVMLTLQLTLTNLGTGPTASGNLTVTLPFTAANSASGYGTENANTGRMIQGNASAASNVLTIKMETGATALVLNNQIRLTMLFEATT